MTPKPSKLFIQGFVLFIILWAVASVMAQTPALPNPIKVFLNMPKVFASGGLSHMWMSFQRTLLGLSVSLIIGAIIGIAMGSSNRINRILNPLIYFTYPIPKTALLPVIMILFGLGDGSKIMLIVLITVFQVIIAVRDAVVEIPETLYSPMISLGANKWQRFYHITMPAIVSNLLTTLRISVGTALSILFFAENYGTKLGLGYYVQDSWARMDYPSMFGGILLLATLGLLLFIVLDQLEAYTRRWK